MSSNARADMDRARDELMSHIHRCGVLRANREHQVEWLNETVEYLGECYPSLTAEERSELKLIGERFCQPVIPHGQGHSALNVEEEDAGAVSQEETSDPEMAAV